MFYITHEAKCFIYFHLDNVDILLLRSGYSPVLDPLGNNFCFIANEIKREIQLNLGEPLLNEF